MTKFTSLLIFFIFLTTATLSSALGGNWFSFGIIRRKEIDELVKLASHKKDPDGKVAKEMDERKKGRSRRSPSLTDDADDKTAPRRSAEAMHRGSY